MGSKIEIVVGGQFGSEGKGAVGAQLAREARDEGRPYAAVRVAGPNAGHSAFDDKGRKWALRQIPVAGVANIDCKLYIGAGSEVDPEVLFREVAALDLDGLGVNERLQIDQWATVITDQHKVTESVEGMTGRLGSTAKGIGAARADRIMRQAGVYGTGAGGIDTVAAIRHDLAEGYTVMLEGTQGYGLGLSAGHYPKCTSSDCRAIDFLSMMGISPWSVEVDTLDVWVTLRTYPIRVAGNSGALKDERSWDELAQETQGYIEPEKTTVTQKVRRVGEWDPELAAAAVEANGGSRVKVALTFLDYWYPEIAGATDIGALTDEAWTAIEQIEDEVGALVYLVGTGPNSMIRIK